MNLLCRACKVSFLFCMALCSVLLISTSGFAAFTMAVVPRTNPPEAGSNVLEVKILDDHGVPVEKAEVSATIVMQAMGTMPKMQSSGQTKEQGKGVYLINYELGMGGTWEVEITVAKGTEKQSFLYGVTTDVPGIQDKKRTQGGEAQKTSDSQKKSESQNTLSLGVDRIQKIGVRFAQVKTVPLTRIIRTFGVVEPDNTKRSEVVLRFPGYVEKQFKGRLGDQVKAGDPLFTVYSPELVAAQSEFLLLKAEVRSEGRLESSSNDRLRNLGLSAAEIVAIVKSGKPKREITIYAPQKGTLLEINVREGSGVLPNQVLYVIGDLSKNDIVARVFQQDIANIRLGQSVEIQLTGDEDLKYAGHVSLIYPSVNEGSGTLNVRVVPNQFVRQLRPGVYVDLRFPVEFGARLAIPQSALLHSGAHKFVFVDRKEGILEPVEVSTGKSTADFVEITSGLKEGDNIAASGTFLLSSEAQLRSALPKWKPQKTGVSP